MKEIKCKERPRGKLNIREGICRLLINGEERSLPGEPPDNGKLGPAEFGTFLVTFHAGGIPKAGLCAYSNCPNIPLTTYLVSKASKVMICGRV